MGQALPLHIEQIIELRWLLRKLQPRGPVKMPALQALQRVRGHSF